MLQIQTETGSGVRRKAGMQVAHDDIGLVQMEKPGADKRGWQAGRGGKADTVVGYELA